jgi:hypothetical protein
VRVVYGLAVALLLAPAVVITVAIMAGRVPA